MTGAPPQAKSNVVKQAVGVVIALALLWFAFRGIDPAEFWSYLKSIKPVYVLLLCVSGVLSHFMRALRWTILLAPLSQTRIGLFNSFCAVLIGYAVNVVIPRGGEVARLVSISRTEKLPWAGVLPTMFIDRLLDVGILMLLLGFTLVFFPSRATADMPWLVPGGLSLTAATVVALLLLPFMGRIIHAITSLPAASRLLPPRLLGSVNDLAGQFDAGCVCLKNPVNYPAIGLLTIAIWFFYWLNFYLMVFAFGLEGAVSAIQCLVVFTIGSVGVLVPTPGNVGSFHFLVSQGLMLVSGVDKDQALAYASVLHVLCFIVVTCVPAAIAVAIQSGRAGKPGRSGTTGATSSD